MAEKFSNFELVCLNQIEITLQFFTGSLDISETYCDTMSIVAAKYMSSVSGFWFDFLTSLPWSFNDLYAYQVKSLIVR
jgi:hypothetical protein